MIKSLVKLSIVSKNSHSLLKHAVAIQMHYSNQQLNVTEPENEKSSDIEISIPKISSDLKFIDLSNEINFHNTVMNIISYSREYKQKGIPLTDIVENEEFRNLCLIINKSIRKLNMHQTLKLLTALNACKVSSTTSIMQHLLQIIRNSINRITLKQIYILKESLKYMDSTPLSDSLMLAMVQVFEAQVEIQIDKENIKELVEAFEYAVVHRINMNVYKFLFLELNKNKGNINLHDATAIYLKLLEPEIIQKFKNSLNDLFNVLLNNTSRIIIDQAPFLYQGSVMRIFKRIHASLIQGYNEIYNSQLLDQLVDVSIAQNYGLYRWFSILETLNNIRHVNKRLLEYLSKYFYEVPSVFTKFYPSSISLLSSGLANANYKPAQWSDIFKEFINYTKIYDKSSLYSLAIDLAALDYYDVDILQQIFTNFETSDFLYNKHCRQLYRLYYGTKILYPNYSGPWPADKIMDMLNQWKSEHNRLFISEKSPLLSVLEKLDRVFIYVNNNVQITGIEEPIDHLIFLKNGKPILIKPNTPLNNNDTSKSLTNIKDFDIPPNTERLAIIFFKSDAYSRNTETLESIHLLRVKMLEQMSFKVIPILEHLWETTSENRQLYYLQSLIAKNN